MVKTKTKIEKQIGKKTSSRLVETIILAKKNPKWIEVASILTGPRRLRRNVNLSELEGYSGSTVVVCGKVLSQGESPQKLKVAALGYSETAREKLLKAGCEINLLIEEIESNKEAKGVKILK
ncbi:MAG: uL15 family ribosomal protein [Nanoarchaeota archaeon]|nr:uL15 family ribosomal protein [Nanoarchaeota archaeon]